MKALRRTAIGLAVLVSLMLLWLVGGNAYARYRERQVERAWVQSFGARQDRVNRYPRTATNDAARRLEKLAELLTLDLTPRTHGGMGVSSMLYTLLRCPRAAGPPGQEPVGPQPGSRSR